MYASFFRSLSLALLLSLVSIPIAVANDICGQIIGEEKNIPGKPVPTLAKTGENPAIHGDYEGPLPDTSICIGLRILESGDLEEVPHIRIRYVASNKLEGRVRNSEMVTLKPGGKFEVPMPNTTCRSKPMYFTFMKDGNLEVECVGFKKATLKRKA